MDAQSLRKRVRRLIVFFVMALVLSGVSALPLRWEIDILSKLTGPGTFVESIWPVMAGWVAFVYRGITETYREYPFIAYGTDWLAFAHIVIAIAFIGPLKDPVKNIWVIESGMIACMLVIPLSLIAGPVRGIPLFWQMLDCSFGVFGFIPLWITRRSIQQIAELEQEHYGTVP